MIANNPIVERSNPSVRNHAGIREIKIYNGSPEVKPVNTQISILRLNTDCQYLLCIIPDCSLFVYGLCLLAIFVVDEFSVGRDNASSTYNKSGILKCGSEQIANITEIFL